MRKPLQTARRTALWGVYAGLLLGVVYAVGGFFYDLFTTGLNLGTAMAFGAIVGMPLLFGALAFVAGLLVALAIIGITGRKPTGAGQ